MYIRSIRCHTFVLVNADNTIKNGDNLAQEFTKSKKYAPYILMDFGFNMNLF